MKRSNFLFTLLFTWLFAIFAPSVISLINNDGSTVININLNEEEQQEQGKKNQGEEKIVKDNSTDFTLLALVKTVEMGNFYFMPHTDHTAEILLPPPERRYNS
jgi:hypothetical protein